MRYRTDIRFGIGDLICNYFSRSPEKNLISNFFFAIFFFSAAMGGLLGLGLGMSFISVIELLYYIFLRRILVRRRTATESGEKSNLLQNPYPSRTATEIKKLWPDWPIGSTSTTSVSTNASLNELNDPRLVRRGSLNLPIQLQARLYKYKPITICN